MNKIKENQKVNLFEVINNRRSIRKFIDKEIDDETIKKILKAGFRAPFAYQCCSVVYTRNKEKINKLRHMGIYPTTKLFMIFLIDFNRMEKILKQRGYSYDFDDSLLLWLCVQDAALVSENVTLAADALGLGSVLLGSAPIMAEQIKEIFNLPTKVFPVVGLCLGYPDINHLMDIRPRFPLKYSAFEDQYLDYSDDEINECMEAMDEGYITQGYYIKLGAKIQLRKKEDTIDMEKYSWSEHISRKISQGMWSEISLLDILRKQGFDLK